MTQSELEALCAKWQRVLRLQDWNIKPKLVRHYELGGDRVGRCYFKLTKRNATILVLDPADYEPEKVWGYDPEQTLVHELLHVAFAPFDADESTAEGVAQEQVIDALAWALVTLARGVREPDVTSSARVVDLEAERERREANVRGPFIRKIA